MKKSMIAMLYLATQVFVYSQDFDGVKMGIGNGSSTVSGFYFEISERDFSGEFRINRMKSTVRNLKFKADVKDRYNKYFEFLVGVLSADANGVTANFQGNGEYFTMEIGKISYAIKNTDVKVKNENPEGMPVLSANLNLQKIEITPPNSVLRDMHQGEYELYNTFTGGSGTLVINKVAADVNLDRNGKISAKGNLDIPMGKVAVTLNMTIDRDFRSEPFINSLQIDVTNLSADLQAFMDELIQNSGVPLKRKGRGYSLRMSGNPNSPRFE